MPETYSDLVNRVLRDHEGYTGDGKGGVGELPVGDRSTARKAIDKRDLRQVILAGETAVQTAIDAAADATAAASSAEGAMLDVQGATLFAADTATLLANTATSYPAGTVFATRNGGYSYQVVSSNPDLTTAGGVMLRVLPTAGYLPLEAFNPPTSGNAAQTVKKWLERGFALRNITLTARGRYRLDTLVDAHFPATGSGFPVNRPVIEAPSACFEVAAGNADGGIRITKYNNAQQITIRNLEIQSAAPRGTHGSATNGVGLHLYSALRPLTAGFGTTQQSECLLENVRVTFTNPGQTGRWDRGIVIDGFWWPTLIACHAVTNHPGTKMTKDFEAGAGIECVNCYSPFLLYSQALGRWQRNIYLHEDTGMAWEDFQVSGCYGVGGRIALDIASESASLTSLPMKEPGGGVFGGHYNGQQKAIRIAHRRQFVVDGSLLYTTLGVGQSTYADAAGIEIDSCTDARVTISAPEGGHYVSDTDASSGVLLTGTTDYVTIDGCQLGNVGIGVNMKATGTQNRVTGTLWGGGTGSSPAKRILDDTYRLKGPDAYQIRTPSITFGGNAAGLGYGSRDAGLVVNGRVVTFWLDLEVTAKGSSTGSAVITLAGPAPIAGSDFAATINYASGVTTGLMGRVDPSGNIALYQVGASGQIATPLTHAQFSSAFTIKASGTYLAA